MKLAAPASDPRVAAAAEHVLAWIVDGLKNPPRVVDGLPRSHASVHGNALGEYKPQEIRARKPGEAPDPYQ